MAKFTWFSDFRKLLAFSSVSQPSYGLSWWNLQSTSGIWCNIECSHPYLTSVYYYYWLARLHNAVCSVSDCRSRCCKFDSQLDNVTSVEIDHVIISKVILPLSAQKKCEWVNWPAWHDPNSVDWAVKLLSERDKFEWPQPTYQWSSTINQITELYVTSRQPKHYNVLYLP